MAIKTSHDGCDDHTSDLTNKEQLGLCCELALNVFTRIIPRPSELATLPQLYDGCLVLRFERPYLHTANE